MAFKMKGYSYPGTSPMKKKGDKGKNYESSKGDQQGPIPEQNVKLQVNKTSKILERIYQEGFNTVYHNNPEMCTNVLNKIDSLIHKIKTASIDELVMIDALVDNYFQNKGEHNKNQTAEFTKID